MILVREQEVVAVVVHLQSDVMEVHLKQAMEVMD